MVVASKAGDQGDSCTKSQAAGGPCTMYLQPATLESPPPPQTVIVLGPKIYVASPGCQGKNGQNWTITNHNLWFLNPVFSSCGKWGFEKQLLKREKGRNHHLCSAGWKTGYPWWSQGKRDLRTQSKLIYKEIWYMLIGQWFSILYHIWLLQPSTFILYALKLLFFGANYWKGIVWSFEGLGSGLVLVPVQMQH